MFKLILLLVLFLLVSCSGLNRNNVDLSQIRCEQSNYKRSLHLFTGKIMSSPEDIHPVYELSRCYYEALDYHRSLYYIDLVLKKETSVRSLNLKANSLFKIGRTDQSQQAFEQSLKLDPNHPFTLMNLGLVNFSIGKINDAENLWQKIKDKNYLQEPQYLLAIYRISISKNDRASIIHNYQNLPIEMKDQFDWHYPFVQTIIAESSEADRLKFFQQLENSGGKKSENLVLLEKLKAQYPLSNSNK
jgi:tetratricopeptide (TPR) repeat protein